MLLTDYAHVENDEYGKMELISDKIIARKGNTLTEFLENK